MSIFSKLFSSSSVQTTPSSHDLFIATFQEHFKQTGQFYSRTPFFLPDKTRVIEHMMIHPDLGIILFNFFDYSAEELKGVTAAVADKGDNKADIQISSDKDLIRSRLDASFRHKETPVHTVLVCTRLSETDFDILDASFHDLMPKSLTLFEGATDNAEKLLAIGSADSSYNVDNIKQALFCEFVVPATKTLMSVQQQQVMHLELLEDILIKGLPGSGKSSLLIAKALYEKMKRPQLELIIFAPRACNVHLLQAMIFQLIENSQWRLNPADITVSTFESIQKRVRDKEKYDLIACDDINASDLSDLRSLLKKDARLVVASHYTVEGLAAYSLPESFRLPPALCAACEGFEVETLEKFLVFEQGSTFMNTIVILEKLLKEAQAHEISIVHHNTKLRRELCAQINDYFNSIAYLYDDPDKNDGIVLYPLSHMICLNSRYIIAIVDEESEYDPVELISRAGEKSFILGESEAIYNIITQIKGRHNEPD